MMFFMKISFLLLLAHVESLYKEQHRPCSFNALCTCSNGGPDLGSVCCHNIPFMTVPSQINNSAIYIMSLKFNKLRFLEGNSLNGTGLWKLEINHNLLTDLAPNALTGLEKTLSVLDLGYNELVRIPKEAIQNLEKLSNLNLAGNRISSVQNDDFRGVSKTLKILDLSENSLMHIQNDAFRNMALLEVLNLAFNAILSVDDITFQSGLSNLRQIILMGNQLQQIPLTTLSNLRSIKIVNLNKNLISSISEGREIRNRIHLEELHLEYNLIKVLNPESFRLFSSINRLFLKGNPLTLINNTFVTTNMTELHMPHCDISEISRNAFYSIMHTLKVIDLSYNKLMEFPYLPFTKLVELSLAGNEIKDIHPDDVKSFGNILKYLDLQGPKMTGLSQEIMKHLPNLRELMFKKQQPYINSHNLANAGPSMEKLYIVKSSIKTIESGAFQKLGGLKHLDLSYNAISKIGNTTFKDIGHSLEKLILHCALKLTIYPSVALHHLIKLQYIDVTSNSLQYLPPGSFSSFQKLKFLNLNHNEIQNLDSNFINEVNNPNLVHLKIAFNKITTLNPYTFRDLHSLIYLQLNDNLIKGIRKAAFLNLNSLINIELEGNLIEYIENEAFQNLPNIEYINLSYNKLQFFNLKAFDQVGRLSALKIEVDHNEIQNLTGNRFSSHTSINIKSINYSYNNISYLDGSYFDPIRISINILDLSFNKIKNLTMSAFVEMTHLQTLTISNNEIETIDDDEFKGLKSLQILDISKNKIQSFPSYLLEEQRNLRILFASDNNINLLNGNIFSNTALEQLDLSFNNLTEFPEEALLEIRSTLQSLDLAGNHIKVLNFSNMESLVNLKHFSIAQNDLHFLSAEEKLQLPKLISLDLSHNNNELPQWIFEHFPESLEALNLANTSLKAVPLLDTCNLLFLNLSRNSIKTLEPDDFEQLKNLQVLDFSNNFLSTTFSNVWSNLQQLRSLYLQANPIQSISNSSFSHMERLQELFISHLNLQDIQKDAFQQLTALRKLQIDTSSKLKDITLSQILSKNYGIEEIHLNVQDPDLEGIFSGHTPKSLKAIILEGENLKHVAESTFADIQSQDLILHIRNTNITKLSNNLFKNMKDVKNFTGSFLNNKLRTVERIFTQAEKEDSKKYLKQLEMSGNPLNCNCEFAWIWEWLTEYEHENGCQDMFCDETYLRNLREAKCVNMNNKSIINVFKTDLDCFSNSATGIFFSTSYQLIFKLTVAFLYIGRHI
ncbi:chaoptin-like [Stegodyphus dumicola]|uniref:chaoptin-like n=1 Tax=Stegodyphus dumicola TaxID=202533 RepID=UPI0015AE43FE|nr:chaoptin-like [Stegodyphus dumicola]